MSLSGPESTQEEESQIIKAILEDALVCEGCPKTDVCVILQSLTQQHVGVSAFLSELESKYKVKVNLRTSITECDHKPEELLVR